MRKPRAQGALDCPVWFGSTTYGDFNICASDVKIEYRPRGKSRLGRTLLFVAGGYATSVVPNPAGLMVQPPTGPWQEFDIPPQEITVKGFRKNLGSDGYAYAALPEGAPVDITFQTSRPYYKFTPSVSKHRLLITANDIILRDDRLVPTAEFCVGQNVAFSPEWVPSLPNVVDTVQRWTLPDKFVNESWQLQELIGDVNAPYGSVNYRRDDDLLTNYTTSCWYVRDPGGMAGFWVNLHFSNGQYVSVAAQGQFSVYRPTVPQWTNFYLGQPQVIIYSGRLGAGNANTSSNGMSFKAYIQSKFAGDGGFRQLISGEYDSDLAVSTDGYELDGAEWARGPYQVYTQVPSPVFFDDEPYLGLASTPYHDSTAMDLSFKDYLMFRPYAGDPGANIFVTLKLTTWGVGASATKIGGAWSVDPGSSMSGPSKSDSDDFPTWTEGF